MPKYTFTITVEAGEQATAEGFVLNALLPHTVKWEMEYTGEEETK